MSAVLSNPLQSTWAARLADLALYGFSVSADVLPQVVSRPQTSAGALTQDSAVLRLKFELDAGDGEQKRLSLASVSPSLRNFSASCGAVLARPELVFALAVREVPSNTVLQVPLSPMPDGERFLSHLSAEARLLVARQMSVRTERRRHALGLSAKLGHEQLHQHIVCDALGPVLGSLMAGHMGLAPHQVQLVAPAEAEGALAATTRTVVLPRFSASDPLSVNLPALAIRRGYFGPRAKTLKRFFNISPHAFGRRLARQTHLHPGDVAAALAACQFSFLFLN